MNKETPDDRLARLTELAQKLIDEVQELAADSGTQIVTLTKRSRTNRRMIWIVIGSVFLDVALTAAMGFGLAQVDQNADRINALTHRLDVAQTETRRGAFCPLYEIFLSSRSDAGRKAAEDPEAYDRAFKVIEDGYQALRCPEFTEQKQPFSKNEKG
ncbi:hypothetical protein [Streptomyces sp. NPDC046925]|uniref:hypothetical protein n=1 Tax=Streptomyces sp. NPDC046925 TaxID=3155375 RepID=UPI0033DEEA74